jgi:hypothetical protein
MRHRKFQIFRTVSLLGNFLQGTGIAASVFFQYLVPARPIREHIQVQANACATPTLMVTRDVKRQVYKELYQSHVTFLFCQRGNLFARLVV